MLTFAALTYAMQIRLSCFTIIVVLALMSMPNRSLSQNTPVSPFAFGLAGASTDSARYETLYRTHVAALAAGVPVDYSGIDSLSIEIPSSAKSIPLTQNTDFGGLRLHVLNRSKHCYLFERVNVADSIQVTKAQIDSGDFRTVPELSAGLHQLIIQDTTPWVEKRLGYRYGAVRKDILLVKEGIAQNSPVSPYNNGQSYPRCTYSAVSEEPTSISNLTVIRDDSCTFKTYCFRLDHLNNLQISNVTILTPESNLVADEAISISNCTNVTLTDVTIRGSYSRTNYYGYGILMNNVWNSRFIRFTGHANWGIFGTNNLNTVDLQNCDLNRFDIHCYGRNVSFSNCTFSELYNQFSSVFGKVAFHKCRFTNFVPILIEPSYNAYTGFEVLFENCVFDAALGRNYLIQAGQFTDGPNSRPELSEKCWPNVTIKNLTVNVPDNVRQIILFKPRKSVPVQQEIGYLSKISVSGVKFNPNTEGHSASLCLCSEKVQLVNRLSCSISSLNILPVPDSKITQATKKNSYPASLQINLKGKSDKDAVRVSSSRLNYNVSANAEYPIIFDKCTLGLVRNTPASFPKHATHTYRNCHIYLNCCDDARYYIDNHALYERCVFIPCDPKMQVDFIGKDNAVTFRNCTVQKRGGLLRGGSYNNTEFSNWSLKGSYNR